MAVVAHSALKHPKWVKFGNLTFEPVEAQHDDQSWHYDTRAMILLDLPISIRHMRRIYTPVESMCILRPLQCVYNNSECLHLHTGNINIYVHGEQLA